MKNIFKIGLLVFMAFSFNACLEDDPITDYTDTGIKPIVLIPNGNWPSVVQASPLALDFKPEAQNLDLYARVSWDKPLNQDVTVTFEKDPSIIEDYNEVFGTEYVELVPEAYKLPSSLSVVIPAGQREAKLTVQLFADKVDLSHPNMIAFRLKEAAGQPVASNFRQIVTPVLVKNNYEDDYAVKGYFFHPSAPRGINGSKYMATVNANRVEGQVGDLGGWLFQFDIDGTKLSNWGNNGSTPPAPASGFMEEDNPAGIGTYPGPGGFTKEAFPNTYDPAKKEFKLHYGYGGGATSPAGWTRQIYETWTRQ